VIVVRDIFQAKYGRGDELVKLFTDAKDQWARISGGEGGSGGGGQYAARILTDLSGPFFTVVTETEVESLGEWEQMLARSFSDPEFGAWFSRMPELVESGRREFFTIQAST
jgi:hypothetical protein